MAKAKPTQITNRFDELRVGETYFVQTATKDWVGRLVNVIGPYSVILADASWVADSGRLSVFMSAGRADNMEVEPVGTVCCQWINWMHWPFPLFTEAIPA